MLCLKLLTFWVLAIVQPNNTIISPTPSLSISLQLSVFRTIGKNNYENELQEQIEIVVGSNTIACIENRERFLVKI